ncbi:hypothetical protein BKA83DRAFT_491340 [Pisolithus microcarpus]|nr:hypothetical protein BKA83DRAFT_491340 [Pisolithus microcarpus]
MFTLHTDGEGHGYITLYPSIANYTTTRADGLSGCIGGNRKDSRISTLVPRLRACLARETNAKWKPMQEGDRRERRQLGHITSHPLSTLASQRDALPAPSLSGPTALYLKRSFQDATIKRLQ